MVLRVLLTAASLGTTAAGTWAFHRVLSPAEPGLVEFVLVALFALLLLWIAFSFWTATVGLLHLLRRDRFSLFPLKSAIKPIPPGAPLPRTAVAMPIHNEDPVSVMANIRAVRSGLVDSGHVAAFDFYILSDTTDPDIWLREERAYHHLVGALGPESRVYYRRRRLNTGRKSGNLRDFCERWGSLYECVLVLDADSTMAAETIVEMARRMGEDPKLGILQAPPKPVNRDSLFARCQQFAASVYAEVFTAGFALWTHVDGNYYGHNAIIRVQPFTEHCALPKLSGPPPLGGEILSHDFVEAALLRRAGYTVKVAWDLGGSYEEVPPRLLDYAQRDQRWCQGNLQHARVVPTHGLHPVSRLHLLMGIMSYVSSPLWLAFMLIGGVSLFWTTRDAELAAPQSWAVWIFGLVMLMLLLPRAYAFQILLNDRRRLTAHGNDGLAALSVVLEILISALIAPIMMVFHTVFVVGTLTGRSVSWKAQQRSESATTWRDAVGAYWPFTVIGLVATAGAWAIDPGLVAWLSPVLAGLLLAIPLAVLLDSPAVGRAARRYGLFLIPEETDRPAVLRAQRRYIREFASAMTDPGVPPLTRVVIDPTLHALHLALQRDHGDFEVGDAALHTQLREAFLHQNAAQLDRQQKLAILNDPEMLKQLHEEVWRTWPQERLRAALGR